MRHGLKSHGMVMSGLVSCLALTSVLPPKAPAASPSKGLSTATWTPDNGDGARFIWSE